MQVRSKTGGTHSCGKIAVGKEWTEVQEDFFTTQPSRLSKFEAKPPTPPVTAPTPQPVVSLPTVEPVKSARPGKS